MTESPIETNDKGDIDVKKICNYNFLDKLINQQNAMLAFVTKK